MNNLTPKSRQVDITRGLPKTGQVTSYQDGDDGYYEAGWWKGRLNANNRERFIFKTIGGDDVAVDRATGLMWPTNCHSTAGNIDNTITWPNAIIYAEGLTFAGFSDWRLPNLKELFSIGDAFATPAPLVAGGFTLSNAFYWTSTTYANGTSNAYMVNFQDLSVLDSNKTGTPRMLCVRGGL